MAHDLTLEEYRRYARHLPLPEVGEEGQRRLKSGSVLIVGAGGLGSPAALYLAAAGVGRIGVVDFDVVDDSNLQRQVLHGSASLGRRKVESARARLLDLNPHIQVDVYDEPFNAGSAERIARGYEILLDGSDNFPTRYLINDLCALTGRPDVYGAVFRFEGQVSVFDARTGPCYRCLFPEPPPPGSVPGCAEAGVLGVLPGTIGTLQATEALKLLLGVGEPLIGRLLLYDALASNFESIRLKKNPSCKLCGPNPTVTGLIDYEAFCGLPSREELQARTIRAAELALRLRRGEPIQLLDVREPYEWRLADLPGAVHIPLGQLRARLGELDPAQELVVFCRLGVRSQIALDILREAGFEKALSLEGGLQAWAREVEPGMGVY